MKKKIIPFLFSLFLLAGCGEKKPEPCANNQHDYGEWKVVVEKSCTVPGCRERTCKICGTTDVIDGEMDEHQWQDAADQTGAVAATCKNQGKVITECKVCGTKGERVTDATGAHDYQDAADQTGAVAPSCETDGTVITECKVCGDKSTRVEPKIGSHDWNDWVETTPATHSTVGKETRTCKRCTTPEEREIPKLAEHTWSEIPIGVSADHDVIPYSIYSCTDDNYRKIVWDAKEVTDDTKNVKYNDEDNYKADGDGVKFGGRPIGNAMNLPADWMNHAAVYNADVPGAFVEYKLNIAEAMPESQLIVNMKPASGLDANAGLFLSAAEGSDWTPGLVADEGSEKGYKISDFRFVVYVNNKEVALDASKNVAAADATETGWYNFPCTVNFKKGANTIKIVQAGGWEPTFYQFGVVSSTAIENPIPESKGFEVKLSKDAHVTGLKVFEDKACTIEAVGDKYYSRNEYGRLLNDGEGQISFAVEVEQGYQVKEIKQVTAGDKLYKNIKNPADTAADCGKDNVYRITKIEGDVEFEIITEEKAVVYEGYEFTFVLGEHLTLEIYESKTYNPATLITGLVATSMDKDTLKPTKSGSGQVWVKIIPEAGYVVDWENISWVTVPQEGTEITAETKPFNKFNTPNDSGKDSTGVENGYQFTKVTASATITINAKAA